jgi:hypothetical protein
MLQWHGCSSSGMAMQAPCAAFTARTAAGSKDAALLRESLRTHVQLITGAAHTLGSATCPSSPPSALSSAHRGHATMQHGQSPAGQHSCIQTCSRTSGTSIIIPGEEQAENHGEQPGLWRHVRAPARICRRTRCRRSRTRSRTRPPYRQSPQAVNALRMHSRPARLHACMRTGQRMRQHAPHAQQAGMHACMHACAATKKGAHAQHV